ncbi:MAG TPA: non-ribosomal peptide synthetase [Candidatus Cybelea sp.]|nr:non-ribosomal peptide synthetase [Candidatus Cybelea sp.]
MHPELEGLAFQVHSERRLHGVPYQPVHELVARIAAVQPRTVAVTVAHRSFSYQELDARATQLAGHLQALGVGPDSLVAICMRRSFAMIVASLAVLKAGGAYLPIDPHQPTARLAYMFGDAQVAAVLTAACTQEQIPAGEYEMLGLDPEGNAKPLVAAVWRRVEIEPSNLAYVMYTSGSSGQPKGVEITHGNLSNLLEWHNAAFSVTSADRASQLSGVSFDAAVWELWPYLVAGASVHIPEEGLANDPIALRDWILSQGVTISFLPTPVAERVMTVSWPTQAALRILLTGADTLHHYPTAALPFALVNNYGPTECTVVTTSGVVRPNDNAAGLPAIGRPITNVEVYILDSAGQPVPPGEAGELYIGGAGVGRGYRNRPELTAERFIRSPFATNSHERLYRTGDLVRMLPEGQLAFLGRADEQVKIRGFRIELGEVVCALNEHPHVRESAVSVREFAPGDRRLVAYVVVEPAARLTHAALSKHLGRRLPDYMIPGSFVRIEALPLNRNGKLDRAALPDPDSSNSLPVDNFVAPSTPIEEWLSSVLAPLLGIEQIGVEDNFFMLGGHSLLGTQVIARVRDAFGVELSLRALFDAPTIAALGAEVERLLVTRVTSMSEEEAERILNNSKAVEGL